MRGKITVFIILLVCGSLILLNISCKQNFNEKEHKFGEWSILKEATCTKEGVKKHVCTGCGFEETAIISANGHSYNSGEIIKKATCTEKGIKKFTCSVCNESKTEEIAAKGHVYDSGIITKEATCTEKGVKTFTCSVCSKTKTEEIAAKGHIYDGIKCSVCGKYSVKLYEIGKSYIDADGLNIILNKFTHSEIDGYNTYSINYTLTNNVKGSEIGPGIFKIIYKLTDGSYESSFQTGIFNKMYYGDTLTRNYSWKLTSNKKFVCLEYIADSQMTTYIFSSTPSDELLNWIVE